jgi:cellulose synthase/poly-beta-1,6-N-acetylglucosamine synthase-like glycosyltransferase
MRSMQPLGEDAAGVIAHAAQLQPISIVIPTLNEAPNIEALLMRLHRACASADLEYEAIVVDDHSTDETVAIARDLSARRHLPVRVLLKQGQPGKAYSLIEGFAEARYDVLGMIDGDLQYPPEAIPQMVQRLGPADIVVGDRRASYADTHRLRGTLSQVFSAAIVRGFFGITTDMQSGLKVFTRSTYEALTITPSSWSFDLELITQAKQAGNTIVNVPISFQARHAGASKVAPLSVGTELLKSAYKMKRQMARTPTQSAAGEPSPAGVLEPEHDEARWHDSVVFYRQQISRHTAASRATEEERHLKAQMYIDQAINQIDWKQQQVTPFAPINAAQSAIRTLTRGQVLTLLALMLAAMVGLFLNAITTAVIALSIIITYYLADLLLNCFLLLRTLHRSPEVCIDDATVQALGDCEWPKYTILCPLFHEETVVPQFVRAISQLDYPIDKLQVLLLAEESDTATQRAIMAQRLPPQFEMVIVPDGAPRTKPRACNYGLLRATGEYAVIYDAEDIPDPLQLKKAVLTFASHGEDLGCVQAKLNFYNTNQNILTRAFTAEYSLWFELILPGLQSAQVPLPLGGTSNHFRTATLRDLGAWDPFNVTEDCDLGLRLANQGLRTTILDSVTREEANSRTVNWFRQRSRWIKGYMQTYLVQMRAPWRYVTERRIRDFIALQAIVGGKVATLFINPLMWALTLIYIFMRPVVGPIYAQLFPAPLLYMGMFCLIFGNFYYIYVNFIGCIQRRQYGLLKWMLFTPFYWAMMSIAATIALWQLITKPSFWEKTQHGFHLVKQPRHVTTLPSLGELGTALNRITQTGIQQIAGPDSSIVQTVEP